MANDGSINSQVEEWAVTALKDANPAENNPRFNLIEQFQGTFFKTGKKQAEELTSKQNPVAIVAMWGASGRRASENPAEEFAELHVWVGVRGGDYRARIGDGDTWGLHRCVEEVIEAIERKRPNKRNGANTKATGSIDFLAIRGMWEQADLFAVDVVFRLLVTNV